MQRSICAALWLLSSSLGCLAAPKSPAPPPQAAPEPQMVPASALQGGLWNVNVVREVPGTPNRRTVSTQVCFTNNRALQAVLPQTMEDGMSCQFPDAKLTGEVMAWTVQCTGKGGSVQGPASITFAGTSYQGTAALERKAGGKTTKMTETFEGKRVGDCQ